MPKPTNCAATFWKPLSVICTILFWWLKGVERLRQELDFHPVARVDIPAEPHVGGGLVRSDERIARHSRQTVILGVAIAVGVAQHPGIDGTAGAKGGDAGELPVVEHGAQHGMFAVEGMRLRDP